MRAPFFYCCIWLIHSISGIATDSSVNIRYHLKRNDTKCEVESGDDIQDFLALGALDHSSGLELAENPRHYYAHGWPQGARDNERYIEFSVAPKCGYAFHFKDLKFNLYSEADIFGTVKGPRYWDLDIIVEGPDLPVNFWSSILDILGVSLDSWWGTGDYTETIYQQDMCSCYTFSQACICHPAVFIPSLPLARSKNLQAIMPGQKVIFRLHGHGTKHEGKGGWYGNAIVLKGNLSALEDCPVPKDIAILEGPRTVVYLVDGTWGHEEGGHDFQKPSNIARLFNDLKGAELAEVVYFRGIGNAKDHAGDLSSARDYLARGNYKQLGVGAVGIGANGLAEKIYQAIVDRYNKGYTGIILAGWSRGAAIIMQVSNLLYHNGIRIQSWVGGSYISARDDCVLIEQIHLLDTVHSLGLPNADLVSGWYDDVLPPNIRRAWHYLADTENTSTGFKQTRPLNAIELSPCADHFEHVSHGDVGGSAGSECSEIVLETVKSNMLSLGNNYFEDDPLVAPKKSIYNSWGQCMENCP